MKCQKQEQHVSCIFIWISIDQLFVSMPDCTFRNTRYTIFDIIMLFIAIILISNLCPLSSAFRYLLRRFRILRFLFALEADGRIRNLLLFGYCEFLLLDLCLIVCRQCDRIYCTISLTFFAMGELFAFFLNILWFLQRVYHKKLDRYIGIGCCIKLRWRMRPLSGGSVIDMEMRLKKNLLLSSYTEN